MTPWGSVTAGDEMLRFNFKKFGGRFEPFNDYSYSVSHSPLSKSDESDEITTCRQQEIELIEASKP